MANNEYLVFDLGGTYLKYALMNEDGNISYKNRVPSPAHNCDVDGFFQVFESIIVQYEDLISGIAVSLPGIIDSRNGVVLAIGAFPVMNQYEFKRELQLRCNLPVSIENDGKCAALAEVWKGNLAGVRDGAVMVLGTAVGGGIVLDGKLRRGIHFSAGEYSGVCVDKNAPAEGESYFSRLGAQGLIQMAAKRSGEDWQKLSGETLFERINHDHDEDAIASLKEYTDALAVQLFNLNIVLDLEKICIGGGISQQPVLMTYLKESVENLKNVHPDIRAGVGLPLPNIDICRFYNDANLIGALYHYLYEGEDV